MGEVIGVVGKGDKDKKYKKESKFCFTLHSVLKLSLREWKVAVSHVVQLDWITPN